MNERLQKLISASGLMSRRAAETAISEGRVTVNGLPAQLGDRADPETDDVRLDGKPLPKVEEMVYIMLNKPKGYVTTLKDEKGRKDVSQLVKDLGVRVYPVGRLDLNSEGLLLMTNDGEFANMMTHPSHEVTKTYQTWVKGDSIPEALELLRQPMLLDGYTTRPAQAELLRYLHDGAILTITIHEGRNRQVRRMCQNAGLLVTRLKRISEGGLELGELAPGCWRRLSGQELDELRKDHG